MKRASNAQRNDGQLGPAVGALVMMVGCAIANPAAASGTKGIVIIQGAAIAHFVALLLAIMLVAVKRKYFSLFVCSLALVTSGFALFGPIEVVLGALVDLDPVFYAAVFLPPLISICFSLIAFFAQRAAVS